MSDSLPPPLMTSEAGSFAQATIVERKPQIIKQIIDDNGYPPEIVESLGAFEKEIAGECVQSLAETTPDTAVWNREIGGHQGKTWLELPWYLAEAYFYRRLLEAIGYLQPGPWQGQDPFAPQKRRQERIAAEWAQWKDNRQALTFEALLHSSLWGNRADLSNYTVREQARTGMSVLQERHHLLIDDTQEVSELLSAGVERVDILTDNTGRELLSDLALAEFLLGEGWVGRIFLHLKDRPFFVSDAMSQDVQSLVAEIREEALGQRLSGYLEEGCLELRSDPFWTGPFMFRRLSQRLEHELSQSDLVILKGDVNYRRLLHDRHWAPTTPMAEAAGYFPASFLTLRTLKGEIIVGLQPGEAAALTAQDPSWQINGRRGVVHLHRKTN